MGKISILPAHLFLHIRMFINCIMFTKCKHWKFCKHSSNGIGELLIRILQFGFHFRVYPGILGALKNLFFCDQSIGKILFVHYIVLVYIV